MGVDRIKWNMKGFKQLRKSDEIMRDLIARAKKIDGAAGPGYKVTPITGKTRARVSVATDTPAAELDNARNQTLVRALDAGR